MKNKLVIAVVVCACVGAGWRVLGGSGGGDPGPAPTVHDDKLVLDRVWIDHMPRNDRDQLSAFVAITDEPIGVFQTTSVWKGHFEMFRYEAHGGELRLLFPQDNTRESVKAHAKKCSEDGFDYCLELDGASRGVKRYFSRKGWEIDQRAVRSAPSAVRAHALSTRIAAVLSAK